MHSFEMNEQKEQSTQTEYSTSIKDSRLSKFLNSSTVHGLSKIGGTKNPIQKVVWSLVVLVLVCGSLQQSILLLIDFFEYKTYLVTKEIQVSQIKFPSVTLCNLNNYQSSKINRHFPAEDVFQKAINDSVHGNKSVSEVRKLMEVFWSGLETSNFTKIKEMRSGSDSMLLKPIHDWCNWAILSGCSPNDFTDFFVHSTAGFCKTFNIAGNYTQKLAGSLSGFRVTLYLNQTDYANLIPLDSGAGVQVLVHPQDVYPSPTLDGIFVPPGHLAHISIERTVLQRSVAPYPSKCSKKVTNEVFPGRYTVAACRETCFQQKFYKMCGVMDAAFLFHQESKSDINFASHPSVGNCILKFFTFVLDGKLYCDCPLPCYEEQFTTSTSYSSWPTRNDLRYYKPVFAKLLKKQQISNEFVYGNFLAINMFFKDLRYREIVETPAVSSAVLLGSIGGALGLFIGASCFSAIEFAMFLLRFLFPRNYNSVHGSNLS